MPIRFPKRKSSAGVILAEGDDGRYLIALPAAGKSEKTSIMFG